MTAIIAVKQRDCGLVHLCTDAAIYNANDGIVAFAPKVHPIPHWPGAITCSGSAAGTTLFGVELARQFPTWDDMVRGATPDVLRGYFEPYRGMFFSEVWLAGISAARGPEAWGIADRSRMPGSRNAKGRAKRFSVKAFVIGIREL